AGVVVREGARGDDPERDAPAPADAAQHQAIDVVRDPGHRSQDERRIDRNASEMRHETGNFTGGRPLAAVFPLRPEKVECALETRWWVACPRRSGPSTGRCADRTVPAPGSGAPVSTCSS